jgi:hypothetical protein
MPTDVILDQIEEGPLKSKIQNPHRGWVFRTNEEKSAEYILDILQRSGSDEVNQPMTTIRGYWGGVFETIGLLLNKKKMMDAIDQLLVNQPDKIKQQEFDKISTAYRKIKDLWQKT